MRTGVEYSPRAAVPALAMLLAMAFPVLGSQSIDLSTANLRGGQRLPQTSVFSNIRDFRIEAQVDHWVTHAVKVGIWELDSSAAVVILPDNTLALVGFHGEQVGLSLNGITTFRFVGQRNTVTGKYTLELWNQATGEYLKAETAVSQTTAVDCRNASFTIGSLYEPNVPDLRLGFLRWYRSTRPIGGMPPNTVITTYADLLDFEFEGNLKDLSPNKANYAFTSGTPVYRTTQTAGPSPFVGAVPITVQAGSVNAVDATASFSNTDAPGIRCTWRTASAPQPGTWTNPSQCLASFTAPVFGTYNLALTVTDSDQQSVTKYFKIGAVATDANDVVIVNDPKINRILGPMIRFGANPWPWMDDRDKRLADNQLSLLNLGDGAGFLDYWNTASTNGTVAVSYGGTTVTGNGTQFQTDFCGGASNTTPLPATSMIYLWYPHPDYPGQRGRARFSVGQCTSQTSMTLVDGLGNPLAFTHAGTTGTDVFTGLSYTVVNPAQEAPWLYGVIPANYYDNVLAFYSLYYRSGIDTYLDAARALALRWWTGPNWDMGFDWNFSQIRQGAHWNTAGPARGAAVTGLVLWSVDTGANIWPGIHHVWDNWAYYTGDYSIAGGQLGDIREQGYMLAGLGLCSSFDTYQSYRDNICPAAIRHSVNDLWLPLRTPDKTWAVTATQVGSGFFAAADGSVYVSVVTGSSAITLHGSTWSAGDFQAGGGVPKYVWFTKDSTDIRLPGNSSAAVGDSTSYLVANVIDSTHAVLTTAYTGSSGNKGLVASIYVGFGNQPYELGLALSGMARYVYPALLEHQLTTEADTVHSFVVDGVKWLASNAIAPGNAGVYGGRKFLNCEPNQNYAFCQADRSQAGEAMSVFAPAYLLSPDETVRTAADGLFQTLWAKVGLPAPFPPSGTYLCDIDPSCPGGGYMISSAPTSNKWFGFFFGYGFAASWPAARVGGLLPLAERTIDIPFVLASVGNADHVRVTVLQPSGLSSETLCTGSPCQVTVDTRQGTHLFKLDYIAANGNVLSAGGLQLLPVLP